MLLGLNPRPNWIRVPRCRTISLLHRVRERSLLAMVTCFVVTVQNKMILVMDSYENDIFIITIYHFNKL